MLQSHPAPGSLLAGRYRLVRVIGEGGMGVVFEAKNTRTEKRVAIKWLHASIASNPEASKRLVREATATCRVRHPNVVDVYDVVHEADTLFLVMELLEGERLEEVLSRGGIPLHQLVALLLPAMRGVAEAHRHCVIHRDIHPANIFLARQPNGAPPVPKVLDFGISKMGGEDTPALTRSGTTLGTPLYMSYEQLCCASDVDARTDVYSFAVILYEALTGHPPFEADSFAELAVKIATATPIPPKQLQPAIPTTLERLILWAMQRDREQRLESMDAFIRELEPFAAEHAFRAQMTESDRELPAVIARMERGASKTPPRDRAAPRTPAQAERAAPAASVRAAPICTVASESGAPKPAANPAALGAALAHAGINEPAPFTTPLSKEAPAATSTLGTRTRWLARLTIALVCVLVLWGVWSVALERGTRDASVAPPRLPALPSAAPVPPPSSQNSMAALEPTDRGAAPAHAVVEPPPPVEPAPAEPKQEGQTVRGRASILGRREPPVVPHRERTERHPGPHSKSVGQSGAEGAPPNAAKGDFRAGPFRRPDFRGAE